MTTPPKAICFDFDGVILESVDIKTRAFRELFSGYPEHVEAIVGYHTANAGMPRFAKFRYFYEKLLKQPVPSGEIERLDGRFSKLVFDAILRCPFVQGSRQFLERHASRMPLFVVSATPRQELKRIIERRGLSHYFKDVYGSPAGKTENLARLVAEHRLDPASTVFVGDGAADLEAARAAGMPFIARVTADNRPYWERQGVAMIEDLLPLSELLGLAA